MISKNDIEKIRLINVEDNDEQNAQYIYSLFTENENNAEFKEVFKGEFYEYIKNNVIEEQNLYYLLHRIHHIINKSENNKKHSVARKIYKWYSSAAAILIIPLVIAGSILFKDQQPENIAIEENRVTSTIYAPLGSRISFTLPDGTEGWLNSGSTLKYSTPFIDNRNVNVLGEVWFDVKHDDDHPFEITTGNSRLKVLGTEFNLSAYPEEKYLEVVLEKGKVVFSTPGLSSEINMKPNERLILKDGIISIDDTDAFKYSAWKEGKIVFRGDPMDEVARRIERWYNVEVELVDRELDNYVFRGTFQDNSLEEVLRYLSMTSPIAYQIIDRTLLEDGTIPKKKIKLYMKNNN